MEKKEHSLLEPNENDVLCGRGVHGHVANIRFLELAAAHQKEYSLAKYKLDKAHIAAKIVTHIRSMDPPGRFLRKQQDKEGKIVWFDVGDAKAIKKTGQALRAGLIETEEPPITQHLPAIMRENHDNNAEIPPLDTFWNHALSRTAFQAALDMDKMSTTAVVSSPTNKKEQPTPCQAN